MTGNDDLYLKNVSVQWLPDNASHYYDKLTSNYDCFFCDAFSGEEKSMGLLALGVLHDAEVVFGVGVSVARWGGGMVKKRKIFINDDSAMNPFVNGFECRFA